PPPPPPPPPPGRRRPPPPPPPRGLLENDLIFERFFGRYEHDLSDADVGALTRLLELSDNDLMDLLLVRKEPEGDLADPDVIRVLELLRNA
ncbi:FAD assembly factor SdhE, partial [Paraburkholderia dipogonis]|uniref:FAD assembly factor SdhE n=1 Tax=Paraburkholderia dipogonis TaxID=1211383 RepID=UPI0038B9637A